MARKRIRHHSKNKKVNTQNTKMEQNTENQKSEMEKENLETEAEKTSTTDTNDSAADNATEANTEKTSASDDKTDNNTSQPENQEDYREKYNELNDKYLRLMAEFDNYRKRTLKEKMDLTKYAEEDVLKGILKVVDDMERAINNMSSANDMDAVREGVNLIYKKFCTFLESRGLKEVDAMHQELNTDLHEAVAKFTAPSDDLKGKIIDVVEKGYYLHDKVIRFAKVVVGE